MWHWLFSKGATQQGDAIQQITGAFGRYQLFLCFIIFLVKFPVAFHQMAILFIDPQIKISCGDQGECTCDAPEYDLSEFTETMTSEFKLICSKRWLRSFNQMMFQFGTLVGSVVFGSLADRFGRKYPLCAAVVLKATAGLASAFMPDYVSFTFFRFLTGAAVGGTMVTSFVIVMEFVGTQYRDIASALYQLPFNLGHMLLPLIGYYVRDFRDFLICISAPIFVLFCYFFLVPETPRWLITMKRSDQAIKVLTVAARINKRPTDNIASQVRAYESAVSSHSLKKGTLIDLFRTPRIRNHTIGMALNWLACSYCFYGVSQYVGSIGGNLFLTVAIGASLCAFGTLLSIPMLKFMGRRTLLIVFNFLTALVLFLMPIAMGGKVQMVLACLGQVASFVVFVVVYLYCSELFPTVVRNAAVGFSSMMARVGSMIAPFVIDTQNVAIYLPPILFAIPPLIAGLYTFLLPETKDCQLTNTIDEAETFFSNKERSCLPKEVLAM